MNEKIIIALSGGVDSSVSALELLHKGYKVEAIFMKNWEEDDNSNYCNAALDLEYAQKVADKLNIVLHTVNFSYEYWRDVFEDFILQYKLGYTPNPDIICNKEIKFKIFLDYALKFGATKIATGHYARVIKKDYQYQLLAANCDHDQTYFMYLLNQYQLSKSIFPIGNMTKVQVRKIAKENNLPTADKKNSTGICFIGKRSFTDFLSKFIATKKGDIVDVNTNLVLGQHNGVYYYTIGQRKGLGIGGLSDMASDAWYVIDKDIKNNKLFVIQGDNAIRYHKFLLLRSIHWISEKQPNLPLECDVRIRYRQPLSKAVISKCNNGFFNIEFFEKQKNITPGQSAVFYSSDICLGGGIIEKSIQNNYVQYQFDIT